MVFTADTSQQSAQYNEAGSDIPGAQTTESPDQEVTNYCSLIDRLNQHVQSNELFFSLEFFPPRRKGGVSSMMAMLDRMKSGGPFFVDITWHPGGDPAGDSDTSSMKIANLMLNELGLDVMLHITSIGMTEKDLDSHLQRAKAMGIRNIFALRGDIPEQYDQSDPPFKFAVDLVRFIRNAHGDYFTVGVAAYPSGHPDSSSYQDDIRRLKEKSDAGADFIISQLFFDSNKFIRFVEDCRAIGIDIPIIPGIMPIQSYDSMRHVVKLSKLDVPNEIAEKIETMRGDDVSIRRYGIDLSVKMCLELIEAKVAPGFHFYTLNRELATKAILEELGLWKQATTNNVV